MSPRLVPRKDFKFHSGSNNFEFIQVECGQTHTLLLNKAGEVFSFGEGLQGQLGTNVMVI